MAGQGVVGAVAEMEEVVTEEAEVGVTAAVGVAAVLTVVATGVERAVRAAMVMVGCLKRTPR